MSENPPAIVRSFTQEDADVDVMATPYSGVTDVPGWGPSGYVIDVVEHDCPRCDFDRMVRRKDVNVEEGDEVRYWCLHPNCPHYVSDRLSYACHGNEPQRSVRHPAVFETP